MSKNTIKLTVIDKAFLEMLNHEPLAVGGVFAKSNKARIERLYNRRLLSLLFGNEASKVNSRWMLSGNTAYYCPTPLGLVAIEEN